MREKNKSVQDIEFNEQNLNIEKNSESVNDSIFVEKRDGKLKGLSKN